MQTGKAVQCSVTSRSRLSKPAGKAIPRLAALEQILLDDFLHIINPVGSLIHLNCELHILSRAIEHLQGVATTHQHSTLAACKGCRQQAVGCITLQHAGTRSADAHLVMFEGYTERNPQAS